MTMSAFGSPIYVDLDGTLTRSDTLWEGWAQVFSQHPVRATLRLIRAVLGHAMGNASAIPEFKAWVARASQLAVSQLPMHTEVLAYLAQQKEQGRAVILATAAHEITAQQAMKACPELETALATTEAHNLKGAHKLEAIRRDARARGAAEFEYIGNDRADEVIWRSAARIGIVSANERFIANVMAENNGKPVQVFHSSKTGLRDVFRLIRLHQWVKNVLVLVPLAAAHSLDIGAWGLGITAFVAFGLVASATYIGNDLNDLAADRAHPRKRHRVLASGRISIPKAIGLAALLASCGTATAAWLGTEFLMMMVIYTAITTMYSHRLKRQRYWDVLTLATLYTLRIYAGAVATQIAVSGWLLAFSVFVFLSLAMVKRYAELQDLKKQGQTSIAGRGYTHEHRVRMRNLGVLSSAATIVVLALYINRPDISELYTNPRLLWGWPVFLGLWLGWLWVKSLREQMHDDPLVFALRDWVSWAALAALALCGLMAI